MSIYQKLHLFINKHAISGTKSTLGLFLLLAGMIFVKIILFHWFVYHSILVSSLWKLPYIFWGFYLPKISISILIAGFIFVFRNRIWTILVLLLIDIWCIAELVYYRVFGVFFDRFTITMTGNMDGFWSSIPMYFTSTDIIFFLTTLTYCGFIVFLNHNKRNYLSFIVAIIFSVMLMILSSHLLQKNILMILQLE